MNTKQVHRYTMRYLEATGCQVLEVSPAHVTVKLSPEADKDLTNRPYYWGFVERTGVEPETMTFQFIFDPEAMQAQQNGPAEARPPAGVPGAAQPSAGQPDSILGRYFGVTTAPTAGGFTGRIPKDTVTFGSRRLEQLFQVALQRGRFVRLFEDMPAQGAGGAMFRPSPYQTWLCINYKVELACDMKRDELHSFGIDLTNGTIRDRFMDALLQLPLTTQPPGMIHVQPPRLTLTRAVAALEQHLERIVGAYDHGWADDAWERLLDEQARIDGYYQDLLTSAEPEAREAIEQQYEARRQEIDWQYRPRVRVSVINCGLFHLAATRPAGNDVSR